MNAMKNVTIPLTSNLNMNRNKSLTCSSYDILNEINAPVFGGSISPLHYKIDFQGDAKYSVDGERWTMDSNKLYRGGLLFKDFSGEYTFDMVDTKLDMDAIVPYSDYFVGVKIENNAIEWFKINDEFQIVSSASVATFGGDYRYRGFKLTVRDNKVFLIYGFDNIAATSSPSFIKVSQWNGNGFTEQSQLNFAFRTPTEANNWSKLDVIPNENSSTSWFFTMSKLLTIDGWTGYGFSVFRERPNSVNTFKNIKYSSFVSTAEGNFLIEVALQAGSNRGPSIGVDNAGYGFQVNNRLQAFFVDNTQLTMAVGHVQNNADYGWSKAYSTFYWGGHVDGTIQGLNALYPVTPGTDSDTQDNIPTEYVVEEAFHLENRHNKFTYMDKIGSSCLTVNSNGYARLVYAGYGWSSSEESDKFDAPCVNVTFDSDLYEIKKYNNQTIVTCGQRFNAGVVSNASIPTTKDGWNTWWDNRETSNNTCWNPAGARHEIGNGFYALFNGKEGNLAGISYAINKDHIGTLLTMWGSPVQTFEPCSVNDKVIFKDSYSNTVKYIQKRSNITLDDVEIVGEYVLVRCTADENIYDISSGKWAKFSNDWNNRVILGYSNILPYYYNGSIIPNKYNYISNFAVDSYKDSFTTSGSWAAGCDVAFQKEKGFAPSRLYNYSSLSGVVGGEVFINGAILTAENGLDFFFSSGTSAPSYKCTLFGNGSSSSVSNMAGSVYPITSSGSAYFNIPIIGSEIVDSYNGKYGLKIDDSCYTIAYDGIRPVALYNTSSMVDQVDDFFIVQSQYYALIKGYICSLSYSSSNVITGVEQIVCADGMQFIGAFPACAYFYSPAARAIFAFTGDADLQLFVQTDRITEVYASKYYPNCEWIFMSTNDGIYVMSQNNTFRLNGDFGRVKNFYPTKDDYCVMVLEDGRNVFLSMTKKEGWTTIPVEVETAFFCDGDMKKSTITDWYIRVFKGDEEYNGKVTCSAKTMNDIVSQTIKTFDGKVDVKLTKDKFDENDNSMITLHTGCNALGTSCKVVSDYPIAYFGFTIGTDGSTAKSKYNI